MIIAGLLSFVGATAAVASIMLLVTWLLPAWRDSVEERQRTVFVAVSFYFPFVAAAALPIGVAMLRNRRWSRVAARWFLAALIPVVYGMFWFVGREFGSDDADSFYLVFFLATATAWTVVFLVGIVVLGRPAIRSHFRG